MTGPLLARSDFAQAPNALAREWLVTNGLGGFASGTVAQANTRRYHGLLVAALRPPGERVVMVAKVDAAASYGGRRYELAANEFADGTLAPRGFELLSDFRLEGTLPAWTYSLGDARLEQRMWMPNGRNATYLRFTLVHASDALDLELVPLCTYRDYHSHTRGGWSLSVEPDERSCIVTAFDGARPYQLSVDRGEFSHQPDWYWQFHHRAEAERGLDTAEDLFRPGVFRVRLTPGQSVTLIASAEHSAGHSEAGGLHENGSATEPLVNALRGKSRDIEPAAASLQAETARQLALIEHLPLNAPTWVPQLTLAADQFIVRRDHDGAPQGTTVIAGYPWFSDWGRDTMIALPGLTLGTRRTEDAASILRTFAAHTSEGMLPNRFADSGETPEYNTVDATLWYFHAIDAYVSATGDQKLLRDLYPTLRDIIDWHRRGTRFGIRVDAADGLLFAGEAGVQLTWMDAKVGDWVITPRIGKPVEINALWHFALASMSKWARALGDARGAAAFEENASKVAASFSDSFWFADGGYLYDVIDTTAGGRDSTLRPNQIFAVSLGTSLLEPRRAKAVVDACSRHLLTPVGLRSLSPDDSRYAGRYQGGPRERDSVYHQGTVWSWLLGPFALAHFNVYGDAAFALSLLEGLAPHLGEACLGTVSEIFDADAPHTPRGCFAQAWSVAETLRAWHALTEARAIHRPNMRVLK